MMTDRPFCELNLWQRIFADHWEGFVSWFREHDGDEVPEHWQENVEKMLGCGDIREGYYEYLCEDCGTIKKVGFTCKSRLCLRCFKVTVDNWLKTAKKVLFEGVVHRQVVLTVPQRIRALLFAEEEFLKVFVAAGANAVKELVSEWRRKKRIRVGIMAVVQLSGRAGNRNPHLHLVVSEGGVDKDNQWRNVNYFDTGKLRKQGLEPREYREQIEAKFGDHEVRCPNCGSTRMCLIRIWSKSEGVIYDAVRDDVSIPLDRERIGADCTTVQKQGPVQLKFAF